MARPWRQLAATLALVVLTVAPTGYVAVTAWRIGRASHRVEVEAEVGRALGLGVAVESVRYPRPGEVAFRGVRLFGNESRGGGRVEVGRAASVRLRRGDREVALEVDGLRLRADGPRQALEDVGAMLGRAGGVGAEVDRVRLSAADCEIDLGAGVSPYRLSDLVAVYQAEADAPSLRAGFRLAGVTLGPDAVGLPVSAFSTVAGTRCELSLQRDRRSGRSRTTLALRTTEGLPLPARVLDPFFDARGWLGPDARVDGTLALRREGSKEWEGEFRGNLLDLDLAELVGRRFPDHRLRGRGRLAVAEAHWGDRPGQGAGWVEARGELSAGPGAIGAGLLHALNAEMKFRPAARLARVIEAGRDDLNYRALALSFAMTGDGEIRVAGALGGDSPGDLVLVGPAAPIAYAPRGAANVRGLIKTLFPADELGRADWVPLTEKSRMLLCLPVPPDLAARRPLGGN